MQVVLITEQIRWLGVELEAAEKAGEKVIVAAHHPIGAGCARSTHMVNACY